MQESLFINRDLRNFFMWTLIWSIYHFLKPRERSTAIAPQQDQPQQKKSISLVFAAIIP